jgi:hypothetical protein
MQQRPQLLEANLANVQLAELLGDDTLPHARFSSPYERVDVVELPAPELRRTRKRAATISRDDLALRAKARADASVDVFDAACTLRFSAPYERIEIERSQVPHGALTTGSFEAAWFVAPDDAPHDEVTDSVPTSRWIWIVAIMLSACAVAVVAITS